MTQRHHSSFHYLRALLFALLFALPLTGRAQMLAGSLAEGSASLPYSYFLTVQFANGDYYDFTLHSSVASYTGTDFINTVAADSQGTSLVLTVGQVASSFGNYINAITVNSDTNSGFTNNNYWAYWLGSATNPVNWTYSDTEGEDTRTITPGEADGWIYSDGSIAPAATMFAVPEPSAWALVVLGLAAGGAWTVRQRQGRRSPVAAIA